MPSQSLDTQAPILPPRRKLLLGVVIAEVFAAAVAVVLAVVLLLKTPAADASSVAGVSPVDASKGQIQPPILTMNAALTEQAPVVGAESDKPEVVKRVASKPRSRARATATVTRAKRSGSHQIASRRTAADDELDRLLRSAMR